jgi:hypothetical protein
MSYPKPDDADYCPGSFSPIPELIGLEILERAFQEAGGRGVETAEEIDALRNQEWFKCEKCGRWLHPRGKTKSFWPHLKRSRRTRVSDRVRDGLVAYGLNRRMPPIEPEYADD